MGLITKCLWPALTLAVAAAAVFVYFYYPPVCSKVEPAEPVTTTPAPTSAGPTTAAPTHPWEVDYRLPSHITPLVYRVLLHPDLTTGLFSGTVVVTLNVSLPANYVLLNVEGLTVEETILETAGSVAVPVRQAMEYPPNQFWVVLPEHALQPELYRLTLRFSGSMTRDIVGLYTSAYRDPDTGQSRYYFIAVKKLLDMKYEFLIITVIISGVLSVNKEWEHEYRLSEHVVPELYNLLLFPHLNEGTFSGTVIIDLKITAPSDYVAIHHKNLTIENTSLVQENGSANIVKSAFDYPKNEFWVITADAPIKPGNYNLKLDFKGSLKDDIVGFYQSTYVDVYSGQKRNIATTKFEPTYARRAYPCFDEPSFKAKYNISLVRPSSGNYIALSNMNQVGELTDSPSPGFTTVNFATSVPMSTYLACFIVCDFEKLPSLKSKSGFDVSVYARSGQIQKMEYALQIAASTIDFYIEYFGIDYPLPKLDLIAIPDFVSGAMENWGLITFRETSVLYDANFSSTANHLGVSLTTTHELAHMWFGDLVTMKWWDDLWLNEGFATFIEFKGTAHNHPDWDLDTVFLIHDLIDALELDSTQSSHPIIKHVSHPDQITEIFDRISYAKGASVIRMLEGFMGPENFRQGVVSYLKTFQYKNAETNDLWHHLQKFSGGVNIQRVMDTWTRQMGYPVLNIAQTGNKITISQQRFLQDKSAVYDPNESPYKYKWDVPVTCITSENDKSSLSWLLLEDPSLTIDIGNAQWFKLNTRFTGYYRVNYTEHQWTSLRNLLLNDIKALSAADRVNLLDDAFSLAESGLLAYSVPLALTGFLSREDHFVVWNVAAQRLLSIDTHLMMTPAYSDYRRYLRKLITPHINDELWNFPPAASFMERNLKARMISLGCKVGVSSCLTMTKRIFTDWLLNNGSKPHVDIRNTVYYYGIAESGEEEWDKMWNFYLSENDPQEKARLRGALCAVREPWIIARLIERAKNEDFVRSQDFFSVLGNIAGNPSANGLLWDWVRTNWQYLEDRFTLNNRMFGRLLPTVVGTYSTEVKLDELVIFLKQHPEEGAGGSGRKTALESIKLNIAWLKKHLPTLSQWLKNA